MTMNREVSELLEKALSLPPEARAALAGSLLESLDDQVDANAEDEWNREIARRKHAAKSQLCSMAAKSLQLHPAALEELKSAVAWYLERSETAASNFATELDRSLDFGARSDCDYFTSFSIAAVTSFESGVTAGSNRCTTFPSRSTRNLVKFHLISPAMPAPVSFVR
jgi:hypothetical protein